MIEARSAREGEGVRGSNSRSNSSSSNSSYGARLTVDPKVMRQFTLHVTKKRVLSVRWMMGASQANSSDKRESCGTSKHKRSLSLGTSEVQRGCIRPAFICNCLQQSVRGAKLIN
jgi:hypothetical protein